MKNATIYAITCKITKRNGEKMSDKVIHEWEISNGVPG